MSQDSRSQVLVKPPTRPGLYRYSGGNQTMVFALTPGGQWHAFFSNAGGGPCEWGYIEQCLSVYELIPLTEDSTDDKRPVEELREKMESILDTYDADTAGIMNALESEGITFCEEK